MEELMFSADGDTTRATSVRAKAGLKPKSITPVSP